MGCCLSKQEDLYIDVPRVNSTTDTWALRQKSFLGGCKLLPSTASTPASYPYQTLTRVVLGEDHLFAALWEGHGGSQAARHCVTHCYETLLECLLTQPDPSQALKQATKRLDETFFASDLPDIVKAGVGATGVMMYINTRSNKCFIARMGNSLPFVAESKGSFNTTSIDVKHLSSAGSHRVSFAHLAAGKQRAAACAVSDPEGPSTYTHAIGLGFGKSKKLQQLWLKQEAIAALKQYTLPLPFISSDCEVSTAQFAQEDETVVLASEALLEVLPAREIGLLLHHFNAANLNTMKQALAAVAAQQEEAKATAQSSVPSRGRADKKSQPTNTLVPSKPNVANVVIHHALSKVIDQFNVAMERHYQSEAQQGDVQKLTYADLVQLPLIVDKEAFRPQGDPQVKLHLPKGYALGGLNKSDVHGDMGIVVISLNWPRSRDSQPVSHLSHLSPLRPGRTIRPDAQYRWQLLRSSVKFYLAYRRSLRSRWWQLIDEVQIAAEEAARQREVEAWRTKGEAVKVNLAGEELNTDMPTRTRHSAARPLPFRSAPASNSGVVSGRVAAAVAAFNTPPSIKSTERSAGSRAATTPGSSSSSSCLKDVMPGAAGMSSHSARDVAADHKDKQPGRSSSTRLKPSPARLQITAGYDESLEESDIESPKVDSPTKAAAQLPFSVQSGKQQAATMSPSKAAYSKQSLSLRASRASGLMETPTRNFGDRDSTPAHHSGTSWSTAASKPTDARKELTASPVKVQRAVPGISRDGSSKGYEHTGLATGGQGSNGRGGSPTKMSRAEKISLRPAKPVVR